MRWSQLMETFPQLSARIATISQDFEQKLNTPLYRSLLLSFEIQSKLAEFELIAPLLRSMSRTALRRRHYIEILQSLKSDLPADPDKLTLGALIDAGMLSRKAEILAICGVAVSQTNLEMRLSSLSRSQPD